VQAPVAAPRLIGTKNPMDQGQLLDWPRDCTATKPDVSPDTNHLPHDAAQDASQLHQVGSVIRPDWTARASWRTSLPTCPLRSSSRPTRGHQTCNLDADGVVW